jgi:CheY-like chemotaxis protein
MALSWNVLVVDDEEDVHNITKLALKRKTWRERPIVITSARSGKEARALLQSPDAPNFQCALVDVVMETNDAGLQLCDFIRANIPRTTRLILRTGQPGAAPADQVLNDYDIDYYLAKTEVTPERLFVTLRACFRSSQDIHALVAVSGQLRAFTVALQDVKTTQASLVTIMADSLRFLEEKYAATIVFVHDQVKANAPADALAAVAKAHQKKLTPMELHGGEALGLPAGSYVVTTTQLAAANRAGPGVGDKVKRWFQNLLEEEAKEEAAVGLVVRFEHELAAKMTVEFQRDLDLFVANWRMAESSLRLQDKLARDRMAQVQKNYGTA